MKNWGACFSMQIQLFVKKCRKNLWQFNFFEVVDKKEGLHLFFILMEFSMDGYPPVPHHQRTTKWGNRGTRFPEFILACGILSTIDNKWNQFYQNVVQM